MAPPRAIGIDDWAWKRNNRYGTLICDLERRRTIELLPDREPATAKAWLVSQPQIEVVTRDRGGGYALAATRALPHAIQVTDRWHLMANASKAFLSATRSSMREIRVALNGTKVEPTLLTAAERLQYEGLQRREDVNTAISKLAEKGVAIKEIVRRTGHSRGGQVVTDTLNPGVRSGYVNGKRILFSGIQATINYVTSLDTIHVPGRFEFNADFLFVRRRLIDITGVAPLRTDGTFNTLGTITSSDNIDPKFQFQSNLAYVGDAFGASTSVNFIGKQIAARTALSTDIRELTRSTPMRR